MRATERLDEIEERHGDWYGQTRAGVWTDLDGELQDMRSDTVEQQVQARQIVRNDVPDLVAALRAVLKPEITEPPEWLGEKRTFDTEGRSPGNAEYMAYMEAVLTAAHGDDIRWGPILLAIVLDRAVRAAEDAAVITAALDGTR